MEVLVSRLYMLVCVLVHPLQVSVVMHVRSYMMMCTCCSPCLYWNTIHVDRHVKIGTPWIQD